MNQSLPVTIYKHWAGLVGLFLAGFASIALVVYALATSFQVPWADPGVMFAISVLIIALIAAVTVISMYVYTLSYFTLDQDGITVVRWTTLFHNQKTTTEWSDIEDVSAVKSGIFAQLLPFGTINVQTAGTLQNIRMTFTPDSDYWLEVIDYYQRQATP